MEVLSHVELAIECEDDVVTIRKRVRELAAAQKFDSFATAAITTATSELTRNVWVHAGRGVALLEEVGDGARRGLRVVFRDQGKGIADLSKALAGGFSTARSMGLGLSGTRRLVDEFDIQSEPGKGTVVTCVKWKAR